MNIGITGRAQHGKDTIGDYLEEHYAHRRASFAAALKDLALRVNPVIAGDVNIGAHLRLSGLVEHDGWEQAKKHPEVRRFLQDLGSGARDVLGDSIWVDTAVDKLMPGVNYVFTDVRYPNEARRVDVLIRVTRVGFDNGLGDNHPSESNVPTLFANFDVINGGTLNELYQTVDSVMADIREGFIPSPRTLPKVISNLDATLDPPLGEAAAVWR